MSASWWNGGRIIASRQNRQQDEEFQHRDFGIGNGKQLSGILDIQDS
jgi:hypothetical protein